MVIGDAWAVVFNDYPYAAACAVVNRLRLDADGSVLADRIHRIGDEIRYDLLDSPGTPRMRGQSSKSSFTATLLTSNLLE